MKARSVILWALALLIAAATAVFQRVTGPTYPVKGRVIVASQEVFFKLPQSHGGEGDAEIRLDAPDPALSGVLEFQRYRSNDPWRRQTLERRDGLLLGSIPHQPLAGKVAYRVLLARQGGPENPVSLTSNPVVIRFRGDVPAAVLIPHIVGMILAMILSVRAGLEALTRGPAAYALTVATAAALFVGGLLLGPIVQKYAFDAWWTGWPLGQDLTDNKTLVAMLIWLVALWRTSKNRRARAWVIAASLFTLAIWLIPHSVWGSELNYSSTQP